MLARTLQVAGLAYKDLTGFKNLLGLERFKIQPYTIL